MGPIIGFLIVFYSFFYKKIKFNEKGVMARASMGVILRSSGGHPGVILGSAMENFEKNEF